MAEDVIQGDDHEAWRPLNLTIGLHIEQREGGGIRILSSVPGLYLSGANPTSVLHDLGPVMQRLLIDNEGIEWLRGDHQKS